MYWLHRGKSDDYKKPRDLSLAKVSTASSIVITVVIVYS